MTHANLGKNTRPCLKNKAKWVRSQDQVIEHLPSEHKALSSNPSTTKEKKILMMLIIVMGEADS
jgi:hypothetical protein